MHFSATFLGNNPAGGGGGGGGGVVTITFNPDGGDYPGTSKAVTITITNAAKLRWNIDGGAWTTVNALSTVVTVALVHSGHTLYADALDGGGAVRASHNDLYQNSSGG